VSDGPNPIAALVGVAPLAALVLYAFGRVGTVIVGVPKPQVVGLPFAAVTVFAASVLVHRGGGVRGTFAFGAVALVCWRGLDAILGQGGGWQGAISPRALLSGDPAALASLLALGRVLATGLVALAVAALPFVWGETASAGEGDAAATATTQGGESGDD
jgi:hypothetical protein